MNNPNEPTPEQLRAADHPETIDQLRKQAEEFSHRCHQNQQLHNICKRFINKHHIQSKEDHPGVQNLKWLFEDICDCIGYDP